MGIWYDKAAAQRQIMDKAGALLTDAQASTVPSLYGGMKYDNALIPAGTRISWDGRLMRAAVDLWDRPENNPNNASALWDELEYRDGYRIIPDLITVGKAFSAGELGWWGDVLYRSKVNSNVYTPAEYPGNWEVI